jgi:serine/threonine protein kinase
VDEELPPAFGDFVTGSRIASYQIGEQIGRGGMAVVYRARDIRLDRWVALKILAPDLARDQTFRQRFIRESRAAAAVDHPNIIPIFEAGEADGVLFIAMRYVGGPDVRSLIDQAGALPTARAIGIVTQVASALDAAHAHGLVHRDVKPANMLLNHRSETGSADHVYLSDFGVSKRSEATSNLTITGQLVGTLDYLAPEQVEGGSVDGRADVYSLGCAAFEMLSGTPPFKRDQGLAVLWAQLSAAPPALTNWRPDLPPAIDQVIARALAKAPGDRYDTCLGFASSLQGACGLRAGTSAGAPAPTEDVYAAGPRPTSPGQAGLPAELLPRSYPPADPPVRPPAPPDWPASQPAYWSASSPPPPPPSWPSQPPSQAPGQPARPQAKRPAGGRLAIVAAFVVVLVLAGGAFLLRDRFLPKPDAPASRPPAASSSAPAVVPAASPATTVQRYIAAINAHDYRRAWLLGGDHSGSTYAAFTQGFKTTKKDSVSILEVSGDAVRARVTALQSDGTVQVYQGFYIVQDGVITGFKIVRTG